MPIVVAGAIRTASGLGASARLSLEALRAEGVPVRGLDLSAALMQAVDFTEPVHGIDATTVTGPGTLILHVNAPLVPLAMLRIGRRRLAGKYVVGYWAWELPQMPEEWRHGVPFVHEIWVPSRYVADAVRPIANGRPVRVVPHPVCARYGEAAFSQPRTSSGVERPFTVLTLFDMKSSLARKNPLATVSAFRKAFGDDIGARLIVKASNLDAYPNGAAEVRAATQAANITLLEHTVSTEEIDLLYRQSDVFISLHRAEGFGLTLAEAMLHGLPVVATDWSGNSDFLSAETGMPVPYRLVKAIDPQGTYQHVQMWWADADVTAAAESLRRLRADRNLAHQVGWAGLSAAKRFFSTQRHAQLLREILIASR